MSSAAPVALPPKARRVAAAITPTTRATATRRARGYGTCFRTHRWVPCSMDLGVCAGNSRSMAFLAAHAAAHVRAAAPPPARSRAGVAETRTVKIWTNPVNEHRAHKQPLMVTSATGRCPIDVHARRTAWFSRACATPIRLSPVQLDPRRPRTVADADRSCQRGGHAGPSECVDRHRARSRALRKAGGATECRERPWRSTRALRRGFVRLPSGLVELDEVAGRVVKKACGRSRARSRFGSRTSTPWARSASTAASMSATWSAKWWPGWAGRWPSRGGRPSVGNAEPQPGEAEVGTSSTVSPMTST